MWLPLTKFWWGLAFIVGLSGLSLPAAAGNNPLLERIHAQLEILRRPHGPTAMAFHFPGSDPGAREATPVLTDVKHELRDWIERRLERERSFDDRAQLIKSLNAELIAADLTCTEPSGRKRCVGADPRLPFDGTGYIVGVSVDLQQSGTRLSDDKHEQPYGVIVVRTQLGILCGSDTSVYVYEWDNYKLKRVLEDEQSIVLGKLYSPQNIDAVYISQPDDPSKTSNVLILGNEEWCSSTFYPTYHRIWRIHPDGSPASLLSSDATYSWLGGNDPPIEGSIGEGEALVEFRVPSFDVEVHSYEEIRHYRLSATGVERIDPIALGPRAFTEAWLKADWPQSKAWLDTPNAPSLRDWHQRLHTSFLSGEFDDTTKCSVRPDLWQVAIKFTNDDWQTSKERKYVGTVYFIVRWTPPYRFRMVAVGPRRLPECSTVDQGADEDRTLFPVQDWVDWK